MIVIQVYAPTLDPSEKEKDSFYEDLMSTINAEREYYRIVMSDFNGNPKTQFTLWGGRV